MMIITTSGVSGVLAGAAVFCSMTTVLVTGKLAAQLVEATYTLVEVETFRLPEDVDPVGVVGSEDGTIALWTDQAVFVVTDGTLAAFGQSVLRPLAVAPKEDGWEVVDTGQGTIVRFFPKDAEPQATPLALPNRPYSAARMRCGWVLQLWDARTGSGSLVLVEETGNVAWSLDSSWAKKPAQSSGQLVRLVGTGDQVTATALGFPFEAAVVDCAGNVDMLDPGPPLPATDGWIALGTVQIPGGFVTTYSDITSDQRLVRRRGPRGRFIRDTTLNVPLGFAAPFGTTGVLAVRRTDYLEIVVYRLVP